MTPAQKNASDPNRVLHGGSWDSYGPSWVRAASRSTFVPAYRNDHIGFRCALRGREPLKATP